MADHDGYTIKALTSDTWEAFADLAERHNGVWNGCWCTWFITAYAEKDHTADGNRAIDRLDLLTQLPNSIVGQPTKIVCAGQHA